MRKAIAASVLCILVLFSVLAIAQDAGMVPDAGTVSAVAVTPAVASIHHTLTAGARLLDQLVEVLAVGAAAFITALLGKLILAVENKFKVSVPDAAEVKLQALLDKGIHYAEEQGHKYLATNSSKLAMSESLEHAANFVLDLADTKNVKQLSKDKVKMLIESRLNSKRPQNPPTPAVEPVAPAAAAKKVK